MRPDPLFRRESWGKKQPFSLGLKLGASDLGLGPKSAQRERPRIPASAPIRAHRFWGRTGESHDKGALLGFGAFCQGMLELFNIFFANQGVFRIKPLKVLAGLGRKQPSFEAPKVGLSGFGQINL